MENRIIQKDLYCEVCSLQFDKKYVFDLHMSLVHGKKIKIKKEAMTLETKMDIEKCPEKQSFQCEICQASFKYEQGLKRHKLSVHDGMKPFKCEICSISFTQKPSLKVHMKSVHEGKKPFKCDICDTKFARKSTLKNHITSVHEQLIAK